MAHPVGMDTPDDSRRDVLKVAGFGALLAAGFAAGLPPVALAAEQSFAQFIAGLRPEALARGISGATFDMAFRGVEPIPRVIELDRKQPESTMTMATYQQRVVTQKRIDQGRAKRREHAVLLDRISAAYGVEPEVIVAFWGVESSFGERQGTFSVIASLATLAWDGRRAAFFRKELLNALEIADRGIRPFQMTGSWAGAMGQCQFMPSSYLAYARDGDGDGIADIWTNEADVFASAANYLVKANWKRGAGWGKAVFLPQGMNPKAQGETKRTADAWARLGLRAADGGALAPPGVEARLIAPDGPGSDAWLVWGNWNAIMRWNRSSYFGVAIGRLADAMAAF